MKDDVSSISFRILLSIYITSAVFVLFLIRLQHGRAVHRFQVWHPHTKDWQLLQSFHVSLSTLICLFINARVCWRLFVTNEIEESVINGPSGWRHDEFRLVLQISSAEIVAESSTFQWISISVELWLFFFLPKSCFISSASPSRFF